MLQKIGVAAVVEGLSSFLGDMDKVDNSISKLSTPTNFLGAAFEGLGNIVSGLIGGVFRVLEYTLGTLIAGAITYVTGQIKELIANTIEAAGEFQKLELRLNTLNFNALVESGMDYNAATEISIQRTQEQLTWLQKLAATTPYDNTDISNVYTLARGYGFVDKEARGLTETITDFTSGMGLGNTEIVRIVKNFGQMQQLGKIMQRDLNDLATGAFVPVNDVLKLMQEQTGLTGDAFDDFKKTGEGVEAFITAFTTLVEGRFGGSAQKMARTFGAATDNLKDFFKSVLGLNVVKPILDVLGGRLADFMDELTEPKRWDAIVGFANRMGTALSGIVSDVLGLGGGAGETADLITNAFKTITEWLEDNRGKITEFVQTAITGFKTDLLPVIEQVWKFLFGSSGEPGAIQKFGEWLKTDFLPFIQTQVIPGVQDLIDRITGVNPRDRNNNQREDPEDSGGSTPLEKIVEGAAALSTALPTILELIESIGEVIKTAFGGDDTQTFAQFISETFIPALQDLKKWIDDNKEGIATFFKLLLLLEIFAFLGGLVIAFVSGLVSLVAAIITFGAVVGIILLVGQAFRIIGAWWEGTKNAVVIGIQSLIYQFEAFKYNITKTVAEIKAKITAGDWVGAGKALVQGIIRGIQAGIGSLISVVQALALNALNTFKSVFNIQSPSKVMEGIGENIVKGLAVGVKDSTGLAVKAMSQTASAMMSQVTPQVMATMAPSQNTYQTNNNFNLNVNSSASKEPIIQDFGLMASMVGG